MATLVATQPLLVSAQTYVYYKGAQGLVVLPSNTGTNGSTNSGGSTGTGGSGSTSGTGNSGTGSGTSGTPASAPVLSASSNVVAFGTVQAGSVGTSNLVLANTGNAPLTFTAPPTVRGDAAFSSSTNCGATLAANDSCTVVVSFAPTSNASSTGSLSVATNAAGSPFTAVLSGTGSRQAIAVSSTSSLDFGRIPVGDLTSASVVLTNRGNATMNLLAAPALTGDSAFAASTSCASTLAPGASCITTVTFTPTAAATSTGRLNFSTDAPNGLASVALSGTGVMGYAVSSPSSLLFQGTLIGQVSATKVVTFTNSGSADLAISPASVTGQFALMSQTCGNALAAGGVCTYTVSFNPTTQGVATGSLTIPNSVDTQVIGLFGTSEQAAGSTSVSTVDFGHVTLGNSSAPTNVILNNDGNISLAVNSLTVTGPFTATQNCGTMPASVSVTGSCIVSVVYTPTTTAVETGTLSIATGAGTKTVSLTGMGWAPVAQLNTSSLTFANTTVATTSAVQTVSIANVGSAPMAVNLPTFTGPFSLSSTTCTDTVAAGASCNYRVVFQPRASGAVSGTMTVVTIAGTETVTLAGLGLLTAASTDAGSLNLGNAVVGTTSAAQSVTLSNTGNTALPVNSVSVSGPFNATQNCGTLPVSVAVGNTCTINVTFTPTTNAAASGTLTLDTGAAGIQTVSLTGQGLASTGSLSVSSIPFGSFNTGTTNTSPVTFTNTGNSLLTFTSAPAVTGSSVFTVSANTCGATLAANASCTVTVAFSPVAAVSSSGTLTFASNATNTPSTVSLSGTGIGVPVASLSSSTMAFNNVTVGSSNTTLAVVLSNTGTGPITFTAAPAFASGTSPEYTVTGYSCGATLAAGDSCTVNVKFSPSVIGAATGTLNFATNLADSPTQVSLTGTGVQAVGALTAATTANFGSVILGNTSSLVFTYTNSGNIAATGVQASVTGSQLILGSNSCGTAGTPVTVAAGGSCQVTVSFTPGSVGAVSGYSVTVASSAAGSPNTVALSGSGVQVAPTLGSFANVSKAFASGSFALTPPSSNSGGAWTYTSSNPSVASVVNASGVGTVTLTGVGTTTITATQAANVGFTSATATMTLTVTTGTPVLGALTIAAQSYGVAPFDLTAPSSNSTGAFSYTSSNTAVATVSGSTVTVVGVGTTTITANEAATSNFTAASTTATLTVSPGTPTLGAFTIAPATTSSGTVTLTPPTSNSSGAWTFTSGTTSVATISGSTATILSAGTSVITATQAASGNYAAISVTASLNVSQPAMSWNPSDKYSAYVVVTNNNLTVTGGGPGAQGPSAYASIRATNYKSTGKYYWEQTVDNGGPGGVYAYPCGIATSAAPLSTLAGYDMTSGYAWSGRTVSSGAVYGCAADLVNHTFTVYLGTTAQSTVSIPAGTYVPVLGVYSTQKYTANFAGPFLHLPTGFVAWQ